MESTLIFERYACGFVMLWVWETKKEFSVEAELFVYSTGRLELVDCLEHLLAEADGVAL